MSASLMPAAIWRGMFSLIARDCGELLSATDWPSQTGQASWRSSRAARAVGELSGRDRTTRTTIPTTTTRPSASQGSSFFCLMSGLLRRALLAGARGLEPDVEHLLRGRAEGAAHGDSVGGDHKGLGLAGRTEPERGRTSGIDDNGPVDLLLVHVIAHRRRIVVDDDADHLEVGLVLLFVVERLERRRLLPARDAPAVEEVHDVGLVLQVRRRHRLAVECLQREVGRGTVLLYQSWDRRLRTVIEGEHDGERHDDDRDAERDPANRVPHHELVPASAGSVSSVAASIVPRPSTSRLRAGTSANAQPSAMIRPPIQRNMTIV